MASSTDQSADRLSQDLNYSRPGTPDNVFRDVNDSLISAGFMTLRYDKRGGGASPMTAEQHLSYGDLVADAKAALAYLAERVEVAGKPLAVIGFDQGGLIAMRLASEPRVNAVALVSTFARPLADVIGADLIASRGDPAGTAQSAELHEVTAKLVAGQPLPQQQELNANLRPLLRSFQAPYLREVFGLDPLAEARNVKRPALLVRGANDTTVTAEDGARLTAVLPPGSEEIVAANGDHNLGVKGVRDPALMSQVAAWLGRHIVG
jgi:pimeloyl-ACP methyl ester carboxylesterase